MQYISVIVSIYKHHKKCCHFGNNSKV